MEKSQEERGEFRLLSEIKWRIEIRQSGSDICSKLHMQRDTWRGQQKKRCKKIKGQNDQKTEKMDRCHNLR